MEIFYFTVVTVFSFEPHRDKTKKNGMCVDAQADLSLRWMLMPFCWFCHDAAHLSLFSHLKFLHYAQNVIHVSDP